MSTARPRVLSVATAVPPHRFDQEQAKEFARQMFSKHHRNFERVLPIFDNARIRRRYISAPTDWFEQDHSFKEKNDLYGEVALRLSEEVARAALEKAGVDPKAVGDLLFISTTGYVPGIEAHLTSALGLSIHTRRLPLNGLGCAGGVAGLGLAITPASLRPGVPTLVVAFEAPSLTFQLGDKSSANLVSTALFGDGAAAAVVRAPESLNVDLTHDGTGLELLDQFNRTWPGTQRMMGWDVIDPGLKIVIDRSIPTFVRQEMPNHLERMREAFGVEDGEVTHHLVHPGGARVLEAFEKALDMEPGALNLSWEVLRDYGNMSSVTVFFVLERFLNHREFGEAGAKDELGVLSALGPGFSVEHVLFRCAG